MMEGPNLARKYRSRDYTTEPIRTRETPSPRGDKLPGNRPSNKKRSAVVLILMLIALACITVLALLRQDYSYKLLNEELGNTQKNVDFPLYVPLDIPKGFIYKKSSITSTNGVVIYYLKSSQNEKIFISQQSKPPTETLNDFYKRVLSNPTNVISTQGKAVLGTKDHQVLGSLATDKTWILLNTNSNIDRQVLSQLISNMLPLK